MKTFEKLDLLEFILNRYKVSPKNCSGVAIISVQHLLKTTGSLFSCLIDFGIPTNQILLMGKLYSNNNYVGKLIRSLGIEVQRNSDSNEPGNYYDLFIRDCQLLWVRFLEKISHLKVHTIIVLDDGGGLISTVPVGLREKYCIIGIEQTTSGIEKNLSGSISIINVAGSAVKRLIEPSFISQAVLQKARKYLHNYKPKTIGILGLGNIGFALARDLIGKFPLCVYDPNKKDVALGKGSLKIATTSDECFLNSDFIIGATGKDVSCSNWISIANSNKIFISVSSGDIEFKSLLKRSNDILLPPINSLLDDVNIKGNDNYVLTILRGGTPINFDNNGHSVLPEYIQLTRALLLIGIIQATEYRNLLCKKTGIIKLDPTLQYEILREWSNLNLSRNFEYSFPLNEILSLPFIKAQSLGLEIYL